MKEARSYSEGVNPNQNTEQEVRFEVRKKADCRKWQTRGPCKQNICDICSSYYLKWIENRWIKLQLSDNQAFSSSHRFHHLKVNIWTRWSLESHSDLNIHDCKQFQGSPGVFCYPAGETTYFVSSITNQMGRSTDVDYGIFHLTFWW